MKREHEAMRRHEVSMRVLREATGWDDETAWSFIETLPYSDIPDATDALAVLAFLREHPVRTPRA